MIVLTSPSEMHAWSKEQKKVHRRIGFVPTMGALHDGHGTLLHNSMNECDVSVLSIFVNPAQFNVIADFDKYPRTLESDLAIANQLGIDVVYAPSAAVMYPDGFNSYVEPGHAADPMEGAGRPGHFRGVTTIVLKLFHAVEPDVAFFGKKDFQQLAVIKQMVDQLDMSVTICGVDTVRDDDGLAMSSRNIRLTSHNRELAPIIYHALQSVKSLHQGGERNARSLETHFEQIVARAPEAQVEYVQAVDAQTLETHEILQTDSVMCTAVWFDDVRLIDNIELPVDN